MERNPVSTMNPLNPLGVILNEDGTMADIGLMTPSRHEVRATNCKKSTKHKRRKLLYIGMIVSIFVAVGCGLAATLMFMRMGNG